MSSPPDPPPCFGPGLGQSPVLRAALAATTWVTIEFVHEVASSLACPAFKGPFWRGAYGEALGPNRSQGLGPETSEAWSAMYDSPRGPEPRPAVWCLRPPLTSDEWLPAGTPLAWAVTLFGPARAWLQDCVRAGRGLTWIAPFGAGHASARLRLMDVRLRTPAGPAPLGTPGASCVALDIFEAAQFEASHLADVDLTVRLLTPLRLNAGPPTGCDSLLETGTNQGNVKPPESPHLGPVLRALLDSRLASVQPQLPIFAEGEREAWLNGCNPAPQPDSRVDHRQARVRSTRQEQAVFCGGIVGRCVYGPPASLALPWLRLAEWLQLGAKTRYGQGVISVGPEPPR